MLLLLTACSAVRLADDTEFNVDPLGASLATPYVVGARFSLLVSAHEDAEGWTVTSSDPGVVSLGEADLDEDGEDFQVAAAAVGVGATTFVVRDADGAEMLRANAEVLAPTRFELRAGTDVNTDGDADPIEHPRVCVGGSSSFKIDWYAGDEHLSGAGGLRARLAEEDMSVFLDEADWVTVAPTQTGTLDVALSTGGVEVGTASFEVVDLDAVHHLNALATPEGGAEIGDTLTVQVVAIGGDFQRILGVPMSWQEGGLPMFEDGDRYTYEFDPDASTEVTVTAGDVSKTFTVHGAGGSVGDTAGVACAVANVGPIGAAVWLAVLGMRRRRRG